MRVQEASSSSSRNTHHVFLSFRGEDTRKTFTGHLYTSLIDAGIRTFVDDVELERGESIKSELEKAIKESRISIIVFSNGYASSKSCLDELLRILECKKTMGQKVLPVFYNMKPSQLKEQIRTLIEALCKVEEVKAEAETDQMKKERMDKVEGWKAALREVADIKGMELQDQADGYESRFIQEIVKEVRNMLNRMVLNVTRYPTGIDFRVKKINLWLRDGSTSVGVWLICGVGGIGKTTIAKVAYNLNFDRFEASSFLANIRETSEQPNGLVSLQKQLLSDILKRKKEKLFSVDEGITKIKNAVCCRRTLLVLDDVDQIEQLNAVFGMQDWFCPGSKIIISTRHERLLKVQEAIEMHKVWGLDHIESLRLFSWHAFGQDHPAENYLELCKSIVQHCGGLPLAIQTLGSFLSGASVEVWKNALEKLETIPNNEVQKKLEISYTYLDDHDKKLFLHIACFFYGKEKGFVVKVLKECDLYPAVGIQNLIDRCLVTIGKGNKLTMHQLIQEMGREIVRQESPEAPGMRSRLWHHKHSFSVLRKKSGSERIEGLIFDTHLLKEDTCSWKITDDKKGKRPHSEVTIDKSWLPYQLDSSKRHRISHFFWQPITKAVLQLFPTPNTVSFDTDAFAMMHKLRLLELNHVKLNGSFENFPKKLRWLCWHGFPLKHMPDDFPLESLVALDLQYSSLEQVWEGIKVLNLLKILDLSHCHGLTATPDFLAVPNLERLMLKSCINLVKVHESIGNLERLRLPNLKGCENLRKLPRKIGQLKSLKKLILSGCSKLKWSPTELENLQSLKVLCAKRTAIHQFNRTIEEDNSWSSLIRSWLSKPIKSGDLSFSAFPCTLGKLRLGNCNLSDECIPTDLSGLPLLWDLDLSNNLMTTLPESIKSLRMLKSLWLNDCKNLHSIPDLPFSLRELDIGDCISLEKMRMLPKLLMALTFKVFDGCENLVNFDGLLKLEPLGNFHAEFINDLCIADLESIVSTVVELCNNLTRTKMKAPLQGLYEFGIFSTFIPGYEVPSWFSNKSSGSSVSFIIPSLLKYHKIRGLTICIVYAHSDDHGYSNFHEFYVKISNKSKDLEWIYDPTYYGNEDMMWLSH